MTERTYDSLGDKVTVTFDDSQEAKDKVFQYLMDNYFFKYDAFDGETIFQCDDTNIEAPIVLANIAEDTIKFEVEYED